MNVWKSNIIWQSAAKTLSYIKQYDMSKVHRLSRKRVGLTINVNSETGAYYS